MKSTAWRAQRSDRCISLTVGRWGSAKWVDSTPTTLPDRVMSGVLCTARNPAFLAMSRKGSKRGSVSTSSMITRRRS